MTEQQLIKEVQEALTKSIDAFLAKVPQMNQTVYAQAHGVALIASDEIAIAVTKVRKATLDEVRERLVQNTGLLCSCKEVKHMGLIYSEECPTHVFILATLESKEK